MSRRKKTEEPEVMTLEETPEVIEETPEETEEETPEENAQESEEPTKAEPVAYIGPNIKHIVTRGTVFNNGLPAKLQKKIEDIPAIRGLIVPVSNLAESYKLAKTDGAALNNLYKTVADKLKEG